MNETARKESDWVKKKCRPCEGGTVPLSESEITAALSEIEGWAYAGGEITRTYTFKNYYQTMAFVNAVAYVAHTEDHHPSLEVEYKTCRVRYSTHAIGGVSNNDLICASKLNRLARG